MHKEARLIYRLSRPQTANQINRFIEDVHDRKDDIITQTKIQQTLQEQIRLSLGEQGKFIDSSRSQELLDRLENSLDSQSLEEIQAEITNRRQNVSSLIQSLEQNNHPVQLNIFDHSYQSLLRDRRQVLEDFIVLDPAAQRVRLREIQAEIATITTTYTELLGLLSNIAQAPELTVFNQLTKSKKQEHLKTHKELYKEYSALLKTKNLNSKDEAQYLSLFRDQGLTGRKILLENLKTETAEDKEFQNLHEIRKIKHPDFILKNKFEKQQILTTLRAEIKSEFTHKLTHHKHIDTLTDLDIKILLQTFNQQKGNFEIKLGEACLVWLDQTMELHKTLHEKTKKYPDHILKHFNWEQLDFFQRQKLAASKGELETYYENQEHLKFDQQYSAKLEKYQKLQPLGLINEEGKKNYYKWFQSLNLKQKEDIILHSSTNPALDYLELTKSQRVATNKAFLKLPKNLQAEFSQQYLESGFEERKELMQKIQEETKKLNQAFSEKLDEAISNKLLTPKSKKRYETMFYKTMNLEQRKNYLEKCNLDKPERQQLLDKFEILLKFIDTKEQKAIALKFYNLDYKSRLKYYKTLEKKHKPTNPTDLKLFNSKLKAIKHQQKVEKNSENLTLDIVHQYFLKTARKLEQKNDLEGALKFYTETLELDIELPPKLEDEVQSKITHLKKSLKFEENQTNKQLESLIAHTIQDSLKQDDSLKKEQELLTLVQEAAKLQRNNEKFYGRNKSSQDKMHESLEDNYTEEANLEFRNRFTGYSLYNDHHDKIQVGEKLTFDLDTFDTLENITFWKGYFAETQRLPKEAQSDPRFEAINSKTGITFTADKLDKELVSPAKNHFIEEHLAPEVYKKLNITDDLELQAKVLDTISKLKLTGKLPRTNQDSLAD